MTMLTQKKLTINGKTAGRLPAQRTHVGPRSSCTGFRQHVLLSLAARPLPQPLAVTKALPAADVEMRPSSEPRGAAVEHLEREKPVHIGARIASLSPRPFLFPAQSDTSDLTDPYDTAGLDRSSAPAVMEQRYGETRTRDGASTSGRERYSKVVYTHLAPIRAISPILWLRDCGRAFAVCLHARVRKPWLLRSTSWTHYTMITGQDGPRRRDQDHLRGDRGGWRNGSESHHQQPRARRQLRLGTKRGPVHDFPYKAGDTVVGKVVSVHNGWRVALECDSDILGSDPPPLSLRLNTCSRLCVLGDGAIWASTADMSWLWIFHTSFGRMTVSLPGAERSWAS